MRFQGKHCFEILASTKSLGRSSGLAIKSDQKWLSAFYSEAGMELTTAFFLWPWATLHRNESSSTVYITFYFDLKPPCCIPLQIFYTFCTSISQLFSEALWWSIKNWDTVNSPWYLLLFFLILNFLKASKVLNPPDAPLNWCISNYSPAVCWFIRRTFTSNRYFNAVDSLFSPLSISQYYYHHHHTYFALSSWLGVYGCGLKWVNIIVQICRCLLFSSGPKSVALHLCLWTKVSHHPEGKDHKLFCLCPGYNDPLNHPPHLTKIRKRDFFIQCSCESLTYITSDSSLKYHPQTQLVWVRSEMKCEWNASEITAPSTSTSVPGQEVKSTGHPTLT